jgi:hypothetical protein
MPSRVIIPIFVAAVTLLGAVPLIDLQTRFAAPWLAKLPVLGEVTVSDGRGIIQRYEATGWGKTRAVQPLSIAESKAWGALSAETAGLLRETVGQNALVMFGFRNELYNVNTVNLQELLQSRSAFNVRQVDPVETGESLAGYRNWLQSEAMDACALLTSDRVSGDFSPAINRAFMRQAALAMNFVERRQWSAPDGQNIILWTPKIPPPSCR